MTKLIFASDPFEPTTWEEVEVEDPYVEIGRRLEAEGGAWPANRRVYDGKVVQSRDVTPDGTEESVRALSELKGPIYVVDYPGDPITIIIAIVAVVAIAAVAYLLTRSGAPDIANRQTGSPNNDLASRSNSPRVGGRIADIFGEVVAFPDLIGAPYKVFNSDFREVEVSLMALGRGSYHVPEEDVRDGDTRVREIAGSSVAVYGPGTSPNGGVPQLQIGPTIGDPILNVSRMNEVNGQVLKAPNFNNIRTSGSTTFVYPDTIIVDQEDTDLTNFFSPGDDISVDAAAFTGGSADGAVATEEVKFTSAGTIVFSSFDPSTVFKAGRTLIIGASTYAPAADSTTSAAVTTVTPSTTVSPILDGKVTVAGTDYDVDFTGTSIDVDVSLTGTIDVSVNAPGSGVIDLNGVYHIASVNSTSITLTSPASQNPDWNLIGDLPSDETEPKDTRLEMPAESLSGNLGGTYVALSVTSTHIALSNPVLINADWAKLQYLDGGASPQMSAALSTDGDGWIGPYTMDVATMKKAMTNFYSAQGLYKDDGESQVAFPIDVQLELTPCDEDGVATGLAETFYATVPGNYSGRETRAITMWAEPTFDGRARVRAKRVTPADLNFKGTVVDEVKWRDLYAISPIDTVDFGDVTLVHAKTLGTDGALSLKERKLSVRATRKLPRREEDGSFSTELYPTRSLADIFVAICVDPKIGRRPLSQVDVDGVYDTEAEIVGYFGTAEAAQFCYTFDKQDITFQDTLATVASACFSTSYRRGSTIRLAFDRPTEDSAVLFNHRNKRPGSETRTWTFGGPSEYDGVALEYTDPTDGARVTKYVPQGDESAVNPRKVDTQGVASHTQAHLLAWRAWNRIVYQTTAVEFDAMPEADALIPTQRILIADNTRPDVVDGEVVSQSILKLELSQAHGMVEGQDYTIMLQTVAGVDAMAVYPDNADDPDPYTVVLERAPEAELILEEDEADFRSTYSIVGSANERSAGPFILTDKDPADDGMVGVTAINYDARYYANDLDFLGSELPPTFIPEEF